MDERLNTLAEIFKSFEEAEEYFNRSNCSEYTQKKITKSINEDAWAEIERLYHSHVEETHEDDG